MIDVLRRINEMHFYVTGNCNMRCSYCSDSIKRLTDFKDNFMKIDIAKKYVNLIFKNSKENSIAIIFHGGEPTLQSVEWYEDIIDYITNKAKIYGKEIGFNLQSNCFEINKTFFDLIQHRNIIVGSSLDGPPYINDITRKNGEKVLKNVLKLKKIKKLGGIITVISKSNYNKVSEILKFFEKYQLNNVSFNIVYLLGDGKKHEPLNGLEIFSVFKEIFLYLKETKGKKVTERYLIAFLEKFLKPLTPKNLLNNLNCYSPFCHAGVTTLICDINGNLYPCGCSDFPKYNIGNISKIDETVYLSVILNLHRKRKKYYEICQFCEANRICSFGCPAFHDEDKITEKNLCIATKQFYSYLENELPEKIFEIVESSKTPLS